MEKPNIDYYNVLGVSKDADEATIKQAYRDLSKKYHPDMNENKTQEEKLEAENKIREINEAYAIISNIEKRQKYDESKNASTNYKKDLEKYATSILESVLKEILTPPGGMSTIKANEKAFDDFVSFYKKSEEELSFMGFQFTEYKKYTDISCRGIVSSETYHKIELNIKEILIHLPKDLKAYDEYIKFLNDLENELAEYDKSVASAIERLKGKRGKISANIIEHERRKIIREFENIKRNALAFDEFQEFYKNISELFTILFSKKIINIEEYINPKNRCNYTPTILHARRRDIQNLFDKNKIEREGKLRELKEKLQKRNLSLDSYLSKRKKNSGAVVTIDNVSTIDIKMMLDSMKLMDEIDLYLNPLNITLEGYLKDQGETLEEVKHNELKAIYIALKEIMESYERRSTVIPEDPKIRR